MPAPVPEADWLDRALDFTTGCLATACAWLLDKVLAGAVAAYEFLLHHWLLTGIALAALCLPRLAAWQTANLLIARHVIRTRMDEARAKRDAEKARARKQKESGWLRQASEHEFRSRITALQNEIARHHRLHRVLHDETLLAVGARAAALRTAMKKHLDAAQQLKTKIENWQQEWQRLAGIKLHERVRRLVDGLVNGDDSEAREALTELNGMWRKIDWRSLLPFDSLLPTDQKRVIQLLEMMASNAHVGEARNAFAFVEKILRSYSHNWQEAA